MATFFEQKKITVGEGVYAGVLGGIVAGLTMSIAAMMLAMMMGQEIWDPPKMIAVTILDRSWLNQPGFQMMPVMVGMMVHFATAIGFGILFALIGGRLGYGPAVGWGIIYGLAIWLFMQYFWLRIINPVMAQMPALPFAFEHAVFGGSLGIYAAFLPTWAEGEAKAGGVRAA